LPGPGSASSPSASTAGASSRCRSPCAREATRLATAEVIAAAPREARPWRRAALMLAGLGVLFYVSYGFANWAAGQRSHVPSVVFGWEGLVPFVDWTILPYWTTNLFYAGSLFLCASRAELSV